MIRYTKYMNSPVGRLTLKASDKGLVAVLWEKEDPNRVKVDEEKNDEEGDDEVSCNEILLEAERQLNEYFQKQRKAFDLPLDAAGTDFQKQVWNELLKIPYGETRSYLQIADQLNNRRAIRAVGAANGKNPIGIIVPCHRVIGSSGSLTGFAGGIETKAFLLSLEGVNHGNSQLALAF